MSFLDALQHAYKAEGPGSIPSNTREVLECARRWVEGSHEGVNLLSGVRAVRGKAAGSRDATAADLNGNLAMDPGLRGPMERSYDGFVRMEECLAMLEELVEAGDRGSTPSVLVALEAAGKEVGAAGREMKAWLEEPVARCPRCGSRGESPCSLCGLDLLIPDAEHALNSTFKSAVLPPAFGAVYHAYLAVLGGEARLEVLFSSLDALESDMQTKRRHAEVYGRNAESEAAGKLIDTVDEVLAGVDRMRRVAHTRAMRDLNAGWDLIFGSGRRVGSDVTRVLEEGGRDTQHLHAARLTTDSVLLEGD